MQVSIIIPVLNEAENIGSLVPHLLEYGGDAVTEVIVVDGGSTDDTAAVAAAAGAKVLPSAKGRAVQMNAGAAIAKAPLLYFVHSDTIPPSSYIADIQAALDEDYSIGCFRFQFNSPKRILKINSYFTRFDKLWCRGGDQTLFVTRTLFDEMEGYRNDFLIMEEYDFIIRARKKYAFKIIPKDVLVSARKYDENGYFRVQVANLVVFNMFRFGVSQQTMASTYRRLLSHR